MPFKKPTACLLHAKCEKILCFQWFFVVWGSRGLEFESQHSDQKFRNSSYLGDFRNFFV
nr:MAG TPA: hypothetical protein [Bacteriophage sp.]